MRLLRCDSCPATTTTSGPDKTGWFVFCDSDGPGNARCPACLPDPTVAWSLDPLSWLNPSTEVTR